MDERIIVKPESPLIRVVADQVRGICKDGEKIQEVNEITKQLASDFSENSRRQLANVVQFTLKDIDNRQLNFLDPIADMVQVGYNEKPQFKIKNENGIKAMWLAKGATPQRSYVTERTISVETEAISSRPAINLMDLRTGRVNMADIVREANRQIHLLKLGKIESVLHAAIQNYATPFYVTGIGINQTLLDRQINYFRRLGQVTILGDIEAVSQLAPLVGMQQDATHPKQYSDSQIDEYNASGFIGRYKGCPVIAMENAYENGKTVPILQTNWLYIIPGGLTSDTKNLKVVEEGGIQVFDNQNIDDMTYEMRIDTWLTKHQATVRRNANKKSCRIAGNSLSLKRYNIRMK